MEHDDRASRLEREADDMEEQGERVADQIDDAKADWKAKEQDASVPGAQPDLDDEEDDVSEREEAERSDEEGQGASAEEAEDNPGTQDEDGQATGNPAAAGDEDPEDDG
jgi:hypothetical protein